MWFKSKRRRELERLAAENLRLRARIGEVNRQAARLAALVGRFERQIVAYEARACWSDDMALRESRRVVDLDAGEHRESPLPAEAYR